MPYKKRHNGIKKISEFSFCCGCCFLFFTKGNPWRLCSRKAKGGVWFCFVFRLHFVLFCLVVVCCHYFPHAITCHGRPHFCFIRILLWRCFYVKCSNFWGIEKSQCRGSCASIIKAAWFLPSSSLPVPLLQVQTFP